MSLSYRHSDDGYELGVLTYFFLSLILFFSLIGLIYECHRRKMRNYIDQGYFFIEGGLGKQSRLIPVHPSNVDTSYIFGPLAYFFIILILLIALFGVLFEWQRRTVKNYLDRGYYIVDQSFSGLNRFVLVPPSNVDTSNPMYPKIISPLVVQRSTYKHSLMLMIIMFWYKFASCI